MADPMVLVAADDPAATPRMYACRGCGQVYSPAIYVCRSEEAHRVAREAASDCYYCRTHSTCNYCGAQCSKSWTACAACRTKRAIEKATEVDASTIEECFGVDSGEFYRSPEEAAEAGEEWVFASTFREFHISADSVAENAIDDHHEDASVDDLIGWTELEAAIAAFNARQTGGSFDEDRSRVARAALTRAEQS